MVPVESTGDSVRPAGVVARSGSWETRGAGAHVVRVRHSQIVVKPQYILLNKINLTQFSYPCFCGKYWPLSPTPRCHLRKTSGKYLLIFEDEVLSIDKGKRLQHSLFTEVLPFQCDKLNNSSSGAGRQWSDVSD